MYLGVDIGGTKTFVASLNDEGVIVEQIRFLTPQDYPEFLKELKNSLDNLNEKVFKAGTVAIPAISIDRTNRVAIKFGNLDWQNVNIGRDVEELANCPIFIENDAKLAGLSESMLLKDSYKKVLYVTISTGIGFSFVVDNKIDIHSGDGGGRTIILHHNGVDVTWEDLASGKSIVEKYGRMAKDIDDQETWAKIVKDLSDGLIILIGIFQPDVIVFGGSVGNYFNKYGDLLKAKLESYNLRGINIPALIGAGRPEEAVVYGCYDLAKASINE